MFEKRQEMKMAWWQKLTKQAQNAESGPLQFPIQLELIPKELSVRIFLNDIDSRDGVVACWTYVTNGLRAQNQKELIFSLRRNQNENPTKFPQAPLNIFADIYKLAEQGGSVDEGDISEFATSSFLGHKGLLYLRPEPSQIIEEMEAGLTVIMLTEEEMEAVKAFGPTRVMARFGQRDHYYPCPPWSEQSRPGLSFTRSMQESILVKVPRGWMRGISVYMENDCITLQILPQVAEYLANQLEQIPTNSPLALLTNIDYSANGCLVWEPGHSQLEAITPPNSNGSRLCGCFLLFNPQQPSDRGQLLEDGFMMLLKDTSWESIKHAIVTNTAISVPATEEGMNFQLIWKPTTYHNPIDGIAYQVDGGWETYLPENPQNLGSISPLQVKHIISFTPENYLHLRVGINELASYIKAIEEVVQRYFTSATPFDAQELVIEFEVWQGGKVEVQITSNPETANEIFHNLCTILTELPTPEVFQNSIKFQIVFSGH